MTTTARKSPGRPAKAKTEEIETTPFEPILIHILEDGFTAFGYVWSVGQEIEVDEAHYTETLNLNGESWLDLPSSRFGKGPSPFPNSIIEYVEDFRGQPKKNTYSWFNTANQDKAKLAKAEIVRGRSIPSV